MRWSRIRGGRRRRCPGMKKVPRQSGFAFRCHRASSRKKEREKETHRKA